MWDTALQAAARSAATLCRPGGRDASALTGSPPPGSSNQDEAGSVVNDASRLVGTRVG